MGSPINIIKCKDCMHMEQGKTKLDCTCKFYSKWRGNCGDKPMVVLPSMTKYDCQGATAADDVEKS